MFLDVRCVEDGEARSYESCVEARIEDRGTQTLIGETVAVASVDAFNQASQAHPTQVVAHFADGHFVLIQPEECARSRMGLKMVAEFFTVEHGRLWKRPMGA
jgi:hypothetical protein